MFEIISWLFAVLVILLILFALYPLIYLIPLKIRLGDKAALRYYPLQGSAYYFRREGSKHKDFWAFIKNCALADNQKNKLVLTNAACYPMIFSIDPSYTKPIL
jgi:hypothetical protein